MSTDETRAWLSRRCVHCEKVSLRGNRLGLYTTAFGEFFVHVGCWREWYDRGIERAFNGKCCVCGAKGAPGDPLGICPSGNVAGVVGHPRCFGEWLKRNPDAAIARSFDGGADSEANSETSAS
jgi:hypothetical protein